MTRSEARVEFDEFVAARRASMVRSVVLMGCPEADAEDVVQAALLRCFKHWRKVQHADRPEAYAYRVLLNTLRSSRGRRWHGEMPTDSLPDVGVDADVADGLVVRAALAGMSPEHRAVLVLRYYADLSEADIASALGIAPGTVKSRAARAIHTLANDQSLENCR